MMRWRPWLAGLAVAPLVAMLVVSTSATASRGRASEPSTVDVGPGAATPPVDAVFAETGEDLRRLLADRRGPSEVWLRAREYHGDFTLDRTVALRGERGAAIVGTHTGTVVTITAPDCVLDNVFVRGSGRRNTTEDAGIRATAPRTLVSRVAVDDALFGVSLGPCESCRLEHARVRGAAADPELRGDGVKLWEASDSVVSDNLVEDSRDVVVWYSRRVRFERNIVTRSRYGAHFMYSHDSRVQGSRMIGDVVGIFVMYSSRVRIDDNVLAGASGAAGMGVGFKESDGVSLDGNWFVANTTGAYLDRTPRSASTPVRFTRNVFALNTTALRLHSSEAGLGFTENDFRGNSTSVEVEGGGNALGASFARNYWSDYAGYDLDHDGIGDVPYEVQRLSSDLVEDHPSLRLFSGTVAMGIIDVIARAAPVFASQRLLVDAEPRMSHREWSSSR